MLVEPLWKTVPRFAGRLNVHYLVTGSATPPDCALKRNENTCSCRDLYVGVVRCSQKEGKSNSGRPTADEPISSVVHPYSGILPGHKKDGGSDPRYNVSAPGTHYLGVRSQTHGPQVV